MKLSVLSLFFVLLLLSLNPLVYAFAKIDTTVTANSVIDGVTFETDIQEIIKLADIEHTCTDVENSTGLITTKGLLGSLILGKTVYLDIDSQYVTDNFGTGNRTVSVVYIDHNSTHYLNVNQALVEYRYAIVKDVENDFSPEKWTLYVNKQTVPEFPSTLFLGLLIITTLLIITYKRKVLRIIKQLD
jgi:hypothetical protein